MDVSLVWFGCLMMISVWLSYTCQTMYFLSVVEVPMCQTLFLNSHNILSCNINSFFFVFFVNTHTHVHMLRHTNTFCGSPWRRDQLDTNTQTFGSLHLFQTHSSSFVIFVFRCSLLWLTSLGPARCTTCLILPTSVGLQRHSIFFSSKFTLFVFVTWVVFLSVIK